MSPPVGVTGATGVVGGKTADLLADEGVEQRLVVRSAERAPELPGASVREATYGDYDAARNALEGVERLFMVSAAESADRLDQHRTFVDAAVAAGVRHVVYTSFQGAAPDAIFTLARDHYATEEHIKDSGLDWTFLRDSFYVDFLPMLVGEDGVIRGPAGEGKGAAVTRADVSRSAKVALLDPESHRNRTYTLTGPESLTMDEVAAILQEHRGEPVSFHDETVEEAYESRRKWEAPDWQYDAWVSTYTSIAAGELAEVTGDVERITGRPPESLRQFLDEPG